MILNSESQLSVTQGNLGASKLARPIDSNKPIDDRQVQAFTLGRPKTISTSGPRAGNAPQPALKPNDTEISRPDQTKAINTHENQDVSMQFHSRGLSDDSHKKGFMNETRTKNDISQLIIKE